jgi:mannitol/fructose-specific phosphotransferase system IIA component (Ntr-type)
MAAPVLKLSNMITADRIVDLKATTKNEALKELFAVMEAAPEITNGNEFERSVLEREKILTTGIGFELAIPHVKIPEVSNFVMAIGRSKTGIDFDALDGKPVRIIILIASSDKQKDDFLKVLAKVVLLFKEEAFRKKLLKARDAREILALL